MTYGVIHKVFIDPQSIDFGLAAGLARQARPAYEAEVRSAVHGIEGCYDDLVMGARKHGLSVHEPEKLIAFTDKTAPQGPYDLHVSIRKRKVVFGFSRAADKAVFCEYPLSFTQIFNSVNRYNLAIKGTVFEDGRRRLSQVELDNMVHADLGREEGHDGIIARLFPLNYNKNIMWDTSNGRRQFDLNFSFACRLFSLCHALFPRGPFADAEYGLVPDEPDPRVITPARAWDVA